MKKKKLALHWQIIIGMILGISFGFVVSSTTFTNTMGRASFNPDAAEQDNYVLQFRARNTETLKTDTFDFVFYKSTNPQASAYNSLQVKSKETVSFDLLKAEDQKKYKYLGLIKPGSYTTLSPTGDSLNTKGASEVSIKKQTPAFPPIKIEPNNTFIQNWIKPFGTIFIGLLKMIAVPLILASLIKGVSDLQDISKLSKMGGRTIGFYICTTIIAVTIGLLVVNIIEPGNSISDITREDLMAQFAGDADKRINAAAEQQTKGPLQPLVDLVPQNVFAAISQNGKMLQTILFTIMFGVGLILIDPKKAKPVKDFFDGVNEVILKLIDLIMLIAPYGVFALMAALVADAPNAEIFQALGWYALAVVLGLGLIIGIDLLLIWLFARRSPSSFIKAISPAQLLAFSTSSSAATLPVTMERVEEHVGVEKEVSSFVLPVGATINMDGTSLYQAVAAIFIAQVFGNDLTLAAQLSIIATATLASIGSAAVPGAGMLMLVVVLESIGVNPAGIALIFAIDRPLDMCRTVVNVTGDAMVATLVGKSLGKLGDPNVKDWDDHYQKEEG
ncbi:MAG: dicarboxylate/amino acid:cation symporter [Saprospiraceae bacterium]|nr:dicarboxylate/amino acid:cation symporter [Saprospiraceae bacterium]